MGTNWVEVSAGDFVSAVTFDLSEKLVLDANGTLTVLDTDFADAVTITVNFAGISNTTSVTIVQSETASVASVEWTASSSGPPVQVQEQW